MSQISLACGFCQNPQQTETNLSIGLRITAVALGVLAVIVGALILHNIPGQLGTIAGLSLVSYGTFSLLIGIAVKCIKTQSSSTDEEMPQPIHKNDQSTSEASKGPEFEIEKPKTQVVNKKNDFLTELHAENLDQSDIPSLARKAELYGNFITEQLDQPQHNTLENRRFAAIEYANIMYATNDFQKMMNPILQQAFSQLPKTQIKESLTSESALAISELLQKKSEAISDNFAKLILKKLEEEKPKFIETIANTFTLSELVQLNTLYGGERGKNLQKKTQDIAIQLSSSWMPLMTTFNKEVFDVMLKETSKKSK